MKKILLSIAFIGAVLLGRSQEVVFNEFYPNPDTSGGNNEYLELYNTSSAPINLDCYSILAYDQTTHSGYVYQLPAITIDPFGWVVFTNSTTGTITYGT